MLATKLAVVVALLTDKLVGLNTHPARVGVMVCVPASAVKVNAPSASVVATCVAASSRLRVIFGTASVPGPSKVMTPEYDGTPSCSLTRPQLTSNPPITNKPIIQLW